VVAAVIIHKGPAAFSLGVFSMHERATKNESVRDVIIFALATPVMIAVAFIGLEDASTAWIGMVMLFSAGTFLYVATVDTLPDMHNPDTGRRAMLYVLAGAVLFMLVLFGMDAAGLMEHGH
jgi:zinc transporter 9